MSVGLDMNSYLFRPRLLRPLKSCTVHILYLCIGHIASSMPCTFVKHQELMPIHFGHHPKIDECNLTPKNRRYCLSSSSDQKLVVNHLHMLSIYPNTRRYTDPGNFQTDRMHTCHDNTPSFPFPLSYDVLLKRVKDMQRCISVRVQL